MEFLALENSSLTEQDLLLTEIKQEIEDIADEVNNLQSYVSVYLDELFWQSGLILLVGHRDTRLISKVPVSNLYRDSVSHN